MKMIGRFHTTLENVSQIFEKEALLFIRHERGMTGMRERDEKGSVWKSRRKRIG